jgi:hypothetical protein
LTPKTKKEKEPNLFIPRVNKNTQKNKKVLKHKNEELHRLLDEAEIRGKIRRENDDYNFALKLSRSSRGGEKTKHN